MFITIDDRSSGAGTSCNTCCCEPVALRPGETSLMVLDYSAWSVPIMGRGLVPTPQIDIVPNDDACQNQTIDGFPNPNNSSYSVAVPVSTPTAVNLTTNVTPAGNTFSYRPVPGFPPMHGAWTQSPLTGLWQYTPESAFVGYDIGWYETRDAQGRTIIRQVLLTVGNPGAIGVQLPFEWNKLTLSVDRSKVTINNRMHQISFPIYLPPNGDCKSVEGCRRYRVTIKAVASDCDRLFSKLDCFDVHCRAC